MHAHMHACTHARGGRGHTDTRDHLTYFLGASANAASFPPSDSISWRAGRRSTQSVRTTELNDRTHAAAPHGWVGLTCRRRPPDPASRRAKKPTRECQRRLHTCGAPLAAHFSFFFPRENLLKRRARPTEDEEDAWCRHCKARAASARQRAAAALQYCDTSVRRVLSGRSGASGCSSLPPLPRKKHHCSALFLSYSLWLSTSRYRGISKTASLARLLIELQY